MKLLITAGMLIVLSGSATTAAAVTLELKPDVASEINITNDSSPGWIPTAEQQRQAIKTIEIFLTAIEDGRYAEAYGMQTDGNRRHQTLDQFSQNAEKLQALTGPARSWSVLKITWSKDPTRGSHPGIYVAIDVSARFVKADRHCGYMILYQRPTGGDFLIMRQEYNFLSNAEVLKIEKEHSRAEVEKIWAKLSRRCPNYVSNPIAR